MRVVSCTQGSQEWMEARCGMVTASRMSDVMAFLKKGGETQSRANYRAEILAEILTGQVADHYVSPEMLFGIEQEPFARAAYELRSGNDVKEVGFIYHPSIERCGASPDGLVGKDGGLEIKCPKTSTHLKWIAEGVVPAEHYDQIQTNMLCAGREWWDFVSFDPRLPRRYQLFTVRVPRDEGRIAEINDGVRLFLHEVDRAIEALDAKFPEIEDAPVDSQLNAQLEESLRVLDEDILRVESSWRV